MLGGTFRFSILILAVWVLFSCNSQSRQETGGEEFTGSQSCRECHENFYQLWAPSYHAQAMMPVNAEFIKNHPLPDSPPIEVEGHLFSVEFSDSAMVMKEFDGDKLVNQYRVIWAMGGHNVYSFLTPFEKGKLQNIPLAYDVNGKVWFNYPEAGMRQFNDGTPGDEALPWKDPAFTFNTGCYSCHISQLSTNFDLETGTYHTTWREPGINCETCHGPAAEHIRMAKKLKEGEPMKDVGLVVTKHFTPEQHTASCSPCHAKMTPITPSYMPGDKYFDNYNVTTLEDRDFYPDGRSLGENYSLTEWMLNPCVDGGQIHCVTCHTSSGRDRNKDNPNNSCLQCHKDKEAKFEEHTGHQRKDVTCLSCHMPRREFVGHFLRSDHSFRPPMPEATIRFGSPNACNMCHTDKTPEWANKIVKARKNGNYQEETLEWAQLIKETRDLNWKNIDKVFAFINDPKSDKVVVNSLIRILGNYQDESKVPVLLKALENKSELVRSSAAYGLSGFFSDKVKSALLKACQDSIRLVRIQAANALISFPPERFTPEEKAVLDRAEAEYVTSLTSRLDNWSNHYNLGIYHQNKGETQAALNSYETAARLYPESVMPLINSSVLYSYVGNNQKAEENLKRVLEYDPKNEAANLNLGLLLAEQGRLDEAEKALRTALEANPEQQPVAAKNLSVIVAQKGNFAEAVHFAELAVKGRPGDPEYAYTLAYYQLRNGQKSDAIKTLQKIIKENPAYLNATSFLADIYVNDGNKNAAIKLFQDALKVQGLTPQDRAALQQSIQALQQS